MSTTRPIICSKQANFLDRKDVEVRNLSHGEQRQLEIVLGLSQRSENPAARRARCRTFVRRIHGDGRIPDEARSRCSAILLIEHDMDVVFDVADEISVLHFGEILEIGFAESIKQSRRVQEIYLGTD